ncbi:MAG: hypothetical protein ACPG5Z_00275 [Pseudoalteromonas sp.]
MKYLLLFLLQFNLYASENTYHICYIHSESGKLLRVITGHIEVTTNESVTILKQDRNETIVNGGTVICSKAN